jgi:hypothetical protein
MIRNSYEISRQHDSANMRAWRNVQFAPRPTPAASAPLLNDMPQNPGSSGLWLGLGQAALGGFNTYASMKAPSAGDFQSWGGSDLSGKSYDFSGSFTKGMNFNNPYSFNSSASTFKWNPNNTFGIGSL